eukprot:1422165-Pleurochrysis_carterae.AAC.1
MLEFKDRVPVAATEPAKWASSPTERRDPMKVSEDTDRVEPHAAGPSRCVTPALRSRSSMCNALTETAAESTDWADSVFVTTAAPTDRFRPMKASRATERMSSTTTRSATDSVPWSVTGPFMLVGPLTERPLEV